MRVAASPSFAALLERTRIAHARACWRNAQVASRLAKLALNPRSARLAYDVKVRAVSRAVELDPAAVALGDCGRPAEGLVGLHFAAEGGLHVPIRELSRAAATEVEAAMGLKFASEGTAQSGAIGTSLTLTTAGADA